MTSNLTLTLTFTRTNVTRRRCAVSVILAPSRKCRDLLTCLLIDIATVMRRFAHLHCYSATTGDRCIAMTASVCLSVCPRAYLQNYTSDLYHHPRRHHRHHHLTCLNKQQLSSNTSEMQTGPPGTKLALTAALNKL